MRRKRNFWAKCIAFLLIVVMVLSEQNITTLGETIGSYAQERMAGSSEQQEEGSAKGDEEGQSVPKSMSETDGQQEPSQSQETATEASTSASAQDSGAASQEDTSASEQKNAVSSNSAQSSGQDVDAKQGQNAQKQDEEQKEEEKIVSNDTQETKTKQKKAAAKQQTGDDDEGEKDTANATETLQQVIEENYGNIDDTNNGNRPTASVTIEQIGEKETTIETGNTIDFRLEYVLNRAVNYNYGEQRAPVFDTYDNTQIILNLPEGVSIVDDNESLSQNGITLVAPTDENSNTWILKLQDKIPAGADVTGGFTLTMRVNGNGVYEDGHIFDFGKSEDMMQIETWFTIKDRSDSSNVTDVGTFHKVIATESKINDENRLRAVTDDVWMVKKTPNGSRVSEDKSTVTVKFKLQIGLQAENDQLISESSDYGDVGRVPFVDENDAITQSITLIEEPSVLNREGKSIQAQSIKIIPQFDNDDGSETIEITQDTEAITFPKTLTIPVDTCEGNVVNSNVDPDAPYFSEYVVEVVYPYDDFKAHYADENQEQLHVNNKATIKYQLAGQEKKDSEATAKVTVGEVTQPATLILQKMIQDSNGTNKPYTTSNFLLNDPVSGPVTYTIKTKGGDIPTLYRKNADKTYSVENTSGVVTYNPGQTGQVTVYLDPGEYIVSETTLPANTEKVTDGDKNANDKNTGDIAAGETVTETFYNKEVLGKIEITKKETGSNKLLPGAEFGLYKDSSCTEPIKTATTGSDGKAVFDRIDYDEASESGTTYYVKEITAPEGYLIDNKAPIGVTISRADSTKEITAYNTPNEANVVLQKRVYNPSTAQYENVDVNNYTDFTGAFVLEQKNSQGQWVPVENYSSSFGVGTNGKSQTFTLPVYEEDGTTPIQYRFKETLPEGYHAASETTEGTNRIYTKEFNLVNAQGKIEKNNTVTMDNTLNGSITLTKNFYTATVNGLTANTDGTLTATFDLYKQIGDQPAEKVNTDAYEVKNNTANNTVTITDLPRETDDKVAIQYYLVETSPSAQGYISSEAGGVNTAGKMKLTIPDETGTKEVEAYGPFDFTEKITTDADSSEIVLKQTITINNVENKVPVLVKKQNSYTKAFVKGAKYKIVYNSGDKVGQIAVEETEIRSNQGSLAILEPGYEYIVEETVTPAGYEDVTKPENLIIDLTNVSITANMEAEEVVLLNRPDPSFTVPKIRKNADGTITSLNRGTAGITSPAQFEVYTYDDSKQTFNPVTEADGSVLTIEAGETVQIKAGTYYLKEIVPTGNPNGILDPSVSSWNELYPETITQGDKVIKIGERHGDSFYYGPYTIENQEGVQDLDTITNYSATGAVTVEKKGMGYDGQSTPLDGATIEITSADGQITQTGTSKDGEVTFSGLPIYDEDGQKIIYTIKETAAPDDYTISNVEFTVTLTAGETVTTDSTSGPTPVKLEFVNQPITELTVNKVYYNVWEHAFTNKVYPLPGTEIALYRWDETDGAEGVYKYVTTATTVEETGSATFTGLAQDVKYVAIEVSIPNEVKYQYLEPNGGKAYLEKDSKTYTEETNYLPPTLTEGDLRAYNYVVKDVNTTDNEPIKQDTKTLENVENWTQLHIEKYVMKEVEDQKDKVETPINNAQFNLYMQILDEDTADNARLSFDYNHKEIYTLIGSYSSGTLYDTETGERLDGWFGTDILKSSAHVVYWLEETYAGIGAEIKPKSKYTLIKRDDTQYENATTYHDGEAQVTCNNTIDYINNGITEGEVENDPTTGDGGAMFSTVRIAKWAGSHTETGGKETTFDPLGNVSFELFLTDSEGNNYGTLDILTTGLDNESVNDKNKLTAWASSKAFSWKEIEGIINGLGVSEKVKQDIMQTDTADNHYVRVAIKETTAPGGYIAEKQTYYMYMFFQNTANTTTEIFNDAYYVKDNGTNSSITNADEQQNVYQWALYPTTEDGQTCNVDGAPADADSKQYRLVNWSIDTQAVTVQKYGYEVNNDNLNRTSEGLDAYYNDNSSKQTERKPISVKMKLQRYVGGTWKDWNYNTAESDTSQTELKTGEFITDSAGYFVFPEGLPMGSYRIIELSVDEEDSIANHYELIYDGSDTKKDGSADTPETPKSAAYYFKVKDDSVHITMYNPGKQDLTIKKTDMGDSPLSGVTFTLNNKENNKLSVKGTTANGTVTLADISTGTYTLTEKVADNKYTNSYFEKYFKETFANNTNDKGGNLSDLVSTGIFLGYDLALQSDTNGTSVIVTDKTDIADYGIVRTDGIDLDIKNPEKVSFNIKKKDADIGTALSGAQFDVDYILFEHTNGEDINIATGAKWESLKENELTKGEGLIQITNAEPGIYRITETAPPDGYDLSSNTTQYIVMTGDLNIGTVTVAGVGNTIPLYGTNRNVTVEFANEKQVDLTVKKVIAAGSMNITSQDKFTFTLYDSQKNPVGKPEQIAANSEATFTGLSQGSTYYLKESETEGFKLTNMTTGTGATVTADAEGYYKIEVPNTTKTAPSDITVTATNTYLYGEISFLKVDGETGAKLPGATFEIKKVTGDGEDGEEPVNAVITDNKDGSYTATIPFDGTEEATFRIYETSAPDNYLSLKNKYIEFNLAPGQVLAVPEWKVEYANDNETMLDNRIFPNYKGAYIDLTKYDNVHAAKDTANPLNGITFRLYKRGTDGTWTFAGEKTTEANGSLRFVVDSGIYALEEILPSDFAYQGLEGIYDSQDEKVTILADENGEKVLYVLNGGEAVTEGQSYTYAAYNIPYIPLTIQKYNSDMDSTERLTATAAVYEVPADVISEWGSDIDTVTAEQVTAFIAKNEPLLENIAVEKQGSGDGRAYSYADSTTEPALGKTIVAGKTYLVVEQTAGKVGDTDGGTQIRGHKNVQWYDFVQPEEGTKEGQTATLSNIEGITALTLDKAVEKTEYTSLFTQKAEVEYTITPKVENNYPLVDFTVNDTGLTAYGETGELAYDTYLKDHYSLKQVKLSKASHDTKAYSTLDEASINATVIFKNSDGTEIYEETVNNIGQNGQTVTLPADKGKAAQISVSYESPDFKNSTTKYVLGTDFVPGTITVTAEIDQQEGGTGKKEITSIKNTAESVFHYYKWNTKGVEDTEPSECNATDDVNITFTEQKAPIVSVEKTSDKTNGMAALDSTVTYSITIKNESTEDAPFRNPLIVDYLPQGTTWALDANSNIDATLEQDASATSVLAIGEMTTQTVNGEKAVFIPLNGALQAEESVTVKLKVKIDNTVTAYGTTMTNHVLVGSDVKGVESEENVNQASFKNKNGDWAQDVDTVFNKALSSERLNNLKQILGTRADYGYVRASNTLNWTTATDSVLVKSGYGDGNASQGYTTDVLSSVNNIVEGNADSGTMHYRLAVSNTSADYTTTGFSVIDVLPNIGDHTSKGDERQSAWGLTFQDITNVYVNDSAKPVDYYKIYYFTGTLNSSSAYSAVYNDVLKISYDTAENALPEGWTGTVPDNKQSIKAFIVTTDNTVELSEKDTLVIEYTARVHDGETPWSDEELNNNSWKNAVNNFACTYNRREAGNSLSAPVPINKVLESNEVSTTTMPGKVKVGGIIWIDKNRDGIRQDEEGISNFENNYLIQQMLDNVEVNLTTFRGTESSGATTTYNISGDSAWKKNANYVFGELDPAVVKDNKNDNDVYPSGILNPAALKGTSPSTYTIHVTLPNTVTGIFDITSFGKTCGKSNHPANLTESEQKDNNFTKDQESTSGISATSERFYLWPTAEDVYDNTKDIGVVLSRNLTITKKAANSENTVDGVEFTLYGPFDEGATITADNLTETKKITTASTKKGVVSFENLNWYQQYVVVEESTAAGYTLDEATYSITSKGTNFTPLSGAEKPAWILGVPADSKQTSEDTVTIKNKEIPAKVTLEAYKTLTGKGLTANAYTFNLWDENGVNTGNPIQTKQNDVDGKITFDEISFTKEGTYTYYITEALPEEANGANPYKGVTYDTTVYKATVKVDWVEGTGLVINKDTGVTYEKVGGTGTVNEPTFINTYSASGFWTPEGTKTLTGRDMKDGETFTFLVKDKEEIVSTGTATGVAGQQLVNINFEPIDYTLADAGNTYTYTIVEEKAGQKLNGVTYDSTTYTVEVTVTDLGDGTLGVTPTYKNGNATVNSADFTNSYVPTQIKYAPMVGKTLTGDALPKSGTTDGSKTFTFTLKKGIFTPDDGAEMPTEADCTKTITLTKGTADTDAYGETKFGEITFKKAGTYTFTINETKGNDKGIQYDEAVWTLTVTVTDDGNGNLSKTVTYSKPDTEPNSDKASFTNKYQPIEGTAQLSVSKAVEGASIPKKQKFTFVLSLNGNNDGSVVLPATTQKEITISKSGEENRQMVTFDPITFKKAGEYTFKIEEINDLPDGYTSTIPLTRYAKVVVTDKNGELEADVTYYLSDPENPDDGNIASRFTNEYKTTDTTFTPVISKSLEGDIPGGTQTFTFQIKKNSDDDEGVSMSSSVATVTYNRETGEKSASFEPITFTKAGTYTFDIWEVIPEDAVDNVYQGYTYDASHWTLTVVVEDDNSKLKATGSYQKAGDSTAKDQASFKNSYHVTPATYEPKVEKAITGAEIPAGREDRFIFTMTYKNAQSAYNNVNAADGIQGMSVGDVKEITITGEGETGFGAMTFTKAGTYTFEIKEKGDSKLPGYDYDDSTWTLTVTVVDDKGVLKATPSYSKTGENPNAEKASFTNTYAVTPATYTPQVEKTFSADSVARPTAKDFEFVLTADAGNPQDGAFTGGATGTALAGEHNTLKTTVSGTGTASFDEITFTKAGTYSFTIKETEGADLGYTYDDAEWTLTVTVTDVGGQLTATQTYKSSDDAVQEKDDKAVFENTYSYVASIILNKEVLRGDAAYETNDIFYAGIFTKTTNADGGETTYNRVGDVVTLNNNDSVEVFVPLGGADQTEAITYYVFETDQEGHPLISFGEDGKVIYNQPSVYEISVSSKDKDGNDSHIGEVYVTPNGETMHPEVTITNRVSNVSIEKKDMDGAPLSGATLELWKTADSVDADETADAERTKDDEGNVLLETWVSDGTPHELIAELAIGGTYYLHEKEAPEGYVMAADIPFTVENGEPITLVMEDMAQTQAMGQIAVTKRLSTIDESTFDFVALVAADETFYVGLFTDPEGKHPYGEDYVKPIRIQGASSNTATFDNLPSGTYYVFETLQDGTIIPYGEVQDNNGNAAGSFACISDSSNGTAKEITLDFAVDKIEGTTELNNVYYGDLPDGFSYQGEISITKSIIKNGAPADSSDTFYAGIFTSETENTPYKVVTLKNNGTVTVEVPLGGETGMDPITYYIYETDANGNKLDKNSFAYSVSGEGTVALDLNNTTGSRTIINTMASSSENTTTISPTDDTKTKKTSDKTGKDKNSSTGTSRRTTSSKTGDDNRIALYVLFFGAAVVGIVISLWKRKKYTE